MEDGSDIEDGSDMPADAAGSGCPVRGTAAASTLRWKVALEEGLGITLEDIGETGAALLGCASTLLWMTSPGRATGA